MAIYINTNQNVQINYEISSIGDRLMAYLIDALVIGGIGIGIAFISMIIQFGIGIFLMFSAIAFYHLICELTMNGQSVGKRSQGIRVMKKDGSAASFSAYLLRFLLRPIDSLYGLGLAVIFFTNNNQRLGDLAAGTVIVNVKSEEDLKNQIRGELNVNNFEAIKFPKVTQLTENDIQIIRTILKNREESKDHQVVIDLAKKIAMKIDSEYEERYPYYFLQRIVQDYFKTHMDIG